MLLRIRKFVIGFLFSLVLLLPGISSLLAAEFPPPTGYINDFAGMLSTDFRQELEQDLTSFEKETTAEISVVTINSLEGDSIENYAVKLFEQWGIGKKDKDNGLLLLISKDDRKIRIEVGYGLEPVVTDARAGRIIRDQMTPEFKKANCDQGVRLAVGQIESYIRSGQPPAGIEKTQEVSLDFLPLIIFGFFILIYLSAFWARSKRIWPGGIVGSFLGAILGLIIGTSLAFAFLILTFGFLGFLLDLILSKNYKKRQTAGKSTGFWRSWGGFSGGGGGGGGFGGFGGGSSGGGGASGGW